MNLAHIIWNKVRRLAPADSAPFGIAGETERDHLGAQFHMCQMPAGLEGRVQPRPILDDVEAVPPNENSAGAPQSKNLASNSSLHRHNGAGLR